MSVARFTRQPWHVRFPTDFSRTIEEDDATYRLIENAPRLYTLAQQYASECGECAGTGITPDDQECTECQFIRTVLDAIGGPEYQP